MLPLQKRNTWAGRAHCKGPGPVQVEEQEALLGDFYLLWSQLSSLGQSLQMKLSFMKGLSLCRIFPFVHSTAFNWVLPVCQALEVGGGLTLITATR